MREIKFRAWDKKNKIMLKLLLWDWRPHPPENITPMQYIGLKDKNGVEIYEGDIVKYDETGLPVVFGVNWVDQVMYKDGAWTFEHVLTTFFNELLNPSKSGDGKYHFLDRLEVIGNIYENKELLNG